ncbi:Tho2 protein [Maudiozyma humilis]|uniref:THO complex subunit 2 n=1 Tax=Maudiozyma humilis TaxID=51915 RepID=A0AAV5RS81_MAUHU|nr:Tho2 protein [Kazachstania humilis]
MLERLNKLAKEHQEAKVLDSIQASVFNAEFVSRGSAAWEALISDFKQLETNGERLSWLKKILGNLLKVTCFGQNDNGAILISLDDSARFINDLTRIPIGKNKAPATSMVGKVFIASAKTLLTLYKTDDKLIELYPKLTPLHGELFKFSALSSKLSSRDQSRFWRHYLKKSKYEIVKFNTLPENAVGFSELIMLYVLAYNDVDRMLKINWYINEVNYVCGKYSLDSMRSLDLFLTISTEYLTDAYQFMIEFLSKSDLLNSHQGNDLILAQLVTYNLTNATAPDLHTYSNMCAVLVKANLLDVNIVLNNLKPNDDDLNVLIKDKEDELEEESMKGIDNPLAMAAALTTEEDENPRSYRRNHRSKDKETTDDVTTDSTIPVDTSEETKENSTPELLKFTFLKSLLRHGCFEEVTNFINLHPKCVLLNSEIASLIGELVEYIIQPLYSSMCLPFSSSLTSKSMVCSVNGSSITNKPRLFLSYKTEDNQNTIIWNTQQEFYFKEWTNEIKKITTIDELFTLSHLLAGVIGPQLAFCPKLLTQICRIGIADINNSEKDAENDSETVTTRWIDYFRKFLLPVIPLLGGDSTVTSQLYSLLKRFPFEKRYFLYNEMMNKLSQDVLLLRVESNKAEKEIKSILKSLNIDTISKEARRLSTMVSSNPFATLLTIVKQIENYDKVSELVIYSTRYYSEFAYDVLQYVLLLRLTERRSSMQEDGINPMMWAQRLSIFIASLAKDCPEMDLSNIVEFFIKKVHQGDSIAIIILKELLSRVAGIRDLNEVNIRRIIMLNSGEPVKVDARKLIFDSRDSNVIRAKALTQMFVDKGAVSEILIILYNKMILSNRADGHHKILSMKSDELNNLLWSFVELIQFSLSEKEYLEAVSPFKVLVELNHFSYAWAFHIWRQMVSNGKHENSENILDDTQYMVDVSFASVDFTKISRSLFINFWRYSLYDIHYDEEIYEKEISSNRKTLADETLTAKKKRHVESKIKQLKLSSETHQLHCNRINNYLQEKAATWLDLSSTSAIREFLQYCILPRAMFSPSDAVYTTYFLMNYLTKDNIFEIMNEITSHDILDVLLFSSTILEAGNLGIFYETLVSNVEKVRKNEELSDKMKLNLFDLYTNICYQIINLVCEKNYMSIRNGIEFMKHLTNVFPVVDTHTQLLIAVLEDNLESESREDIKLPINALLGHLKARLRKECIKKGEFCELTSEEVSEKEKYDSEKKEIEEYHRSLENEKKQEELRRKLEENKIKRENKELNDEKDTTSQPNEIEQDIYAMSEETLPQAHEKTEQWPLMKVLNYMSEANYCLKKNDIKGLLRYVTNTECQNTINKALSTEMPLTDFRSTILKTIEGFFSELIFNHKNPDYVYEMNEFKKGCSFLSKGSGAASADMYSDDVPAASSRNRSTVPVDKTNNIIPSAPSKSSASTKSNDTPAAAAGNALAGRLGAANQPMPSSNSGSRFSNTPATNPSARNQADMRGSRSSLQQGPKRERDERSDYGSSKKPRTESGNFKRNANFPDHPRNNDYSRERPIDNGRQGAVLGGSSTRAASDRGSTFRRSGGRDERDGRDARESRDSRDMRAGYGIRDNRSSRDSRDSRDNRGNRDVRDVRDSRDSRDRRPREDDRRNGRLQGGDTRSNSNRGTGRPSGPEPRGRNNGDRGRDNRGRNDDYRYDDRNGNRGGRKDADSRYSQSSSLPSGPRQSSSNNPPSRYQK